MERYIMETVHNRPHSFAISIVVFTVIALIFAGCSSDSAGPGNNTGNGSSTQPAFDSGQINQGGSFSYTFEEVGTVEYYCSIHSPDMQGQVTVSSDAEASERDTVLMENSQFNPAQITVAPSTEVVWINRDSFTHTVTQGNPSTGGNGGGGY
jgi:plastocyanin